MEFLIFLIGIIIAIVNSSNKKKKEAQAAARRRAAAFEAELDEEAAEERRRQQQERARAAEEAKARSRENMAAQEARADARAAAYRQQKDAPKAARPQRWRCRCGRDNDAAANFCVACGNPRMHSTAAVQSGSMNVSTLEGRAASFEGAAVTGEGMSAAGAYMPGEKRREITAPTVTVPGMAKAARHVVKPLTESAHGHVESSISGVDASCHTPDDPILEEEDAYRISEGTAAPQFSLAFDRNATVQGLLYAEILGKPRALRK